MANPFVAGDVVSLLSGGPKMTVVKVNPAVAAANTAPPIPAKDESLECWWFNEHDGTSTLGKAEFPTAAFAPKADAPKKE